ncbi:hypothetical protein OG874_12015 [Nocardia sp. NBC_00565]|nr:hypothetical protein [Nocardia sp. NBC_00565]WUC05812.1 hypothetical protein OG874_12015 [Nocardia sp. NBC_00565]
MPPLDLGRQCSGGFVEAQCGGVDGAQGRQHARRRRGALAHLGRGRALLGRGVARLVALAVREGHDEQWRDLRWSATVGSQHRGHRYARRIRERGEQPGLAQDISIAHGREAGRGDLHHDADTRVRRGGVGQAGGAAGQLRQIM